MNHTYITKPVPRDFTLYSNLCFLLIFFIFFRNLVYPFQTIQITAVIGSKLKIYLSIISDVSVVSFDSRNHWKCRIPMANASCWWTLLDILYSLPEINDFKEPFLMIWHSFRMSRPADSTMYFPKTANVAIWIWKSQRATKALSNFGSSSSWS